MVQKSRIIHEQEAAERELESQGVPRQNGWPTTGTVYLDRVRHGSYGGNSPLEGRERWCGEFSIGGAHFRHRSSSRMDCEQWVKAVRMGRIKPWEGGADWRRVEQRRDLEVRYGEQIVSAAEEACLLVKYHDDKDLSPICDYMTRRLLPHMVYYCCRTLCLGQQNSIDSVKHAISLLLTEIAAGKPVTNFTRTAKRMLRVRKAHRDFWYYEKAPRDVRMVVDGIDFAPLAEVWKITKDRRI